MKSLPLLGKLRWMAFWDLSAMTLILFPFLTGGVWVSQPGFFVELSDLGIPVLLMAILTVFLKWKGCFFLEGSRVIAPLFRLGTLWKTTLEERPLRALLSGAAVAGSLGFTASLRRHFEVNNHVLDLTIYYNAIWNLVNGNGYISAPKGGINLFADHQSPFFWLFSPAVWLFPTPVTLLLIQAFGVATGGVACYFLAKQYLDRGHWGAAALPLLYWGYLPVRNAVFFDFHPETLMLPLFLFSLVGLQSSQTHKRLWGTVALVLALGTKESATALAAGLGAAWVLGAAPAPSRSFCRKLGFFLVPLGLGLFYFDLKIFPGLFGTQYAYRNEFSQYGPTLTDLFLAPLQNPGLFFSQIFGKARLTYLFWTLGPLGFLALWNPAPLLAAAPSYLMLFLVQGDHRVQIIWHYGVEPAVGIFWAMPLAMNRFGLPRISTEFRKMLWILFWALALFGRSDLYKIRRFSPSNHAEWLRRELIPCVDPKASLSTSVALTSHLASRKWVSIFPAIEMPGGAKVQCVIYDPEIQNLDLPQGFILPFFQTLSQKGYQEIFRCGAGLKIYGQGGNGSLNECLSCTPRCESVYYPHL